MLATLNRLRPRLHRGDGVLRRVRCESAMLQRHVHLVGGMLRLQIPDVLRGNVCRSLDQRCSLRYV